MLSARATLLAARSKHDPTVPSITWDSEDARSRVTSGESIWQQDPVWRDHVRVLQRLPSGMRVLELCGGLSSACLALQAVLGDGKFELAGYYDIDEELRPAIVAIHGSSAAVHLGPVRGDILQANIADFADSEMIVTGPPCPPFSDLGVKAEFSDPRAAVFWRVLDVIIDQGQRGCLMIFVVENVKGMLKKRQGAAEPPIKPVVRKLEESMPAFEIEVLLLNTLDFGLPQQRPRIYIVGRRRTVFKGQQRPALLPFQGRVAMRDVVERQLSVQGPYTELQKQNVSDFKNHYQRYMTDSAHTGSVMLVELSRTPSGRTSWGCPQHVPDVVGCLTASGPTLHVFACGEGTSDLSIDRRLTGREHGKLQGFPERVLTAFTTSNTSESTLMRAYGNSMSLPVIGCVLARELRALVLAHSGSASLRSSVSSGVSARSASTRASSPLMAAHQGTSTSSENPKAIVSHDIYIVKLQGAFMSEHLSMISVILNV